MTNKIGTKFKRIWIVIICFIILFSCISFITYGKIDSFIPTGNIDIFDINIDCECEKCEECDKCMDTTSPVINIIEKDETIKKDGLINVLDETDNFENQPELRIFENTAFEMTNKIAPGISNSYHFLIRNNNDFTINYAISFREENINKINMKYRLKLNGYYILGDEKTWLTYEQIITKTLNLKPYEYDNFMLEWKWFDGENDTFAGIIQTNYKLHIKVNAEGSD